MSVQGLNANAGFVDAKDPEGKKIELKLTSVAFRFLDNNRKRTILLGKNYVDDAAAALGGVAIGDLYHTAGVVKVRLA